MPTPSSTNSPIAATTAPVTDQVVIADLAECLIERLASGGRQDDVIERSLGDDRLDRAAAGQAS